MIELHLIEHAGPARFILLYMLDAIRVINKEIVFICFTFVVCCSLFIVCRFSCFFFFCMVSVVKGRFRITTLIGIMLAAKGRCFHTAIDSCAHRDFNGSLFSLPPEPSEDPLRLSLNLGRKTRKTFKSRTGFSSVLLLYIRFISITCVVQFN